MCSCLLQAGAWGTTGALQMVIVTLPFGEHAEYSIHVPNPQRGWPVPQIPGGFKNHPSFPRTKAEMISSLAEARGGCSPCWMLALGWGL